MKRKARRAKVQTIQKKLLEKELCVRLVRCDNCINYGQSQSAPKSSEFQSSEECNVEVKEDISVEPISSLFSMAKDEEHEVTAKILQSRDVPDGQSVETVPVLSSELNAEKSDPASTHDYFIPIITVPPLENFDIQELTIQAMESGEVMLPEYKFILSGNDQDVQELNLNLMEEDFFIAEDAVIECTYTDQDVQKEILTKNVEVSNVTSGKRAREEDELADLKKKPKIISNILVQEGKAYSVEDCEALTDHIYEQLRRKYPQESDSESDSDLDDDGDDYIENDSCVNNEDLLLKGIEQYIEEQKIKFQDENVRLEDQDEIEVIRGNDESQISVGLPDISDILPQPDGGSSFIDNTKRQLDFEAAVQPQLTREPLLSSSRIDEGSKCKRTSNEEKLKEIERTILEFNNLPVPPRLQNIHIGSNGIQIRRVESGNKLEQIRRIRLTHFCKFCKKDCLKLKDHLISKHGTEPEVAALKNQSSKPSERGKRDPMTKLLHAGDLMFNKALLAGNTTGWIPKNNDYGLRVARRPTLVNSSILDYVACPICCATFKEKDFRAHFRICSGLVSRKNRDAMQTGRKMFYKCHPETSVSLRIRIFSCLRNDNVVRALRNDQLIVQYGNMLCLHLRNDKDVKNIKTQLRRLGRLKLLLKVNKLADMLVPNMSETVVNAIEMMASDPSNPKRMKYPTVAQNCATLVKAATNTFIYYCIKNDESDIIKQAAEKFLYCFANDYLHRLSHHARDAHNEHRMNRIERLPPPEEIKYFYVFLGGIRKENYNILLQGFDIEAFVKLLEATLLSLLVFNRRRPGDVQRITLANWNSIKQANEKTSKVFHTLSSKLKDVIKEYSLLRTQGKLGKIVKVLVPLDIRQCIMMLLRYRADANIHNENDYLFGLPATTKKAISHPRVSELMKRYAYLSNAPQPELLTATLLRKQLATECYMNLNLDDAGVTDLANFMSHHVNIHKSVYRKDMVERDIPVVLNFLSTALGITDDIDDLNMNNFDAIDEQAILHPNCDPEPSNDNIDSRIDDPDFTSFSSSKACVSTDSSLASNSCDTKLPPCSTLDILPKNDKTSDAKKKKRWTPDEIAAANKCFGQYLNGETKTITNYDIVSMIRSNPNCFKGRNINSIRTWIYGLRLKLLKKN